MRLGDRELEEEWQPARLAPVDSQVAADLTWDPYVQLLLWLGMTPPAWEEHDWSIPPGMTPRKLREGVIALDPIIRNFPTPASTLHVHGTGPQRVAQRQNSPPGDTQEEANKSRAEAFLKEFSNRVETAPHSRPPRQPEDSLTDSQGISTK